MTCLLSGHVIGRLKRVERGGRGGWVLQQEIFDNNMVMWAL